MTNEELLNFVAVLRLTFLKSEEETTNEVYNRWLRLYDVYKELEERIDDHL